MNLNDVQEELTKSDPTWLRAFEVAHRQLELHDNIENLVRGAWRLTFDGREFMRQLGFCNFNLTSLIDAAEVSDNGQADYELLTQAVNYLGIRYSTVVLTINHACSMISRKSPLPVWDEILNDVMLRVEIGYKLGAKTPIIGMEGGMLMGFVKGFGLGLLMVHDPQGFERWHKLTRGVEGSDLLLDSFGCEPFQVAAAAVQYFGFGPQMAIGAALGMGSLNAKEIDLSDESLAWRAAFQWIDALQKGENHPSDPDVRDFFPELRPQREPGMSNPTLEILYTEAASIRRKGPQWRWHTVVDR